MDLSKLLFLNLTVYTFGLIIFIQRPLLLIWNGPFAFFSVKGSDSESKDNRDGSMNNRKATFSNEESERDVRKEERNNPDEEEPSILDYLKSLLTPWKGDQIRIPFSETIKEKIKQEKISEEVSPSDIRDAFSELIQSEGIREPIVEIDAENTTFIEEKENTHVEEIRGSISSLTKSDEIEDEERSKTSNWRIIIAFLFAFAGQITLEPPDRSLYRGLILYGFAIILILWGYYKGEWNLPKPNTVDSIENFYGPKLVNKRALWLGLSLGSFTFIVMGGNRFTFFNVFTWFLSIVFLVRAFWISDKHSSPLYTRVRRFLSSSYWRVTFSLWMLLVIGGFLLAVFFRLYMLQEVPGEMFSDHAEKLYDVMDVLDGQTRIFFPRNTGREAIHIYVTAAVIKLFNTGISFLSLKLGTALAGLLTLSFIYLLGKEIGGRRVGLFAMVFAGTAYWPNVITRVGLRFTFYPLFVAFTLVFLVQGLRRRRRNDLLISGLFLGLGLHGYSPFRIVPLVVLAAFAIYMLHSRFNLAARRALGSLGALIGMSFMVFLPLLRFITESPENWQRFWFRSLTRLGELEQQYPESPLKIFVVNTWNALTMYWWDNGDIWVHSIPGRPALDVVSAVLFLIGILLVLIRYAKYRKWEDGFLLLSIPLLMLPSILSISFPGENPSLNRSAGAIIPVFVIVGIGLEGLFRAFQKKILLGWGVVTLLLLWSSVANFELVFTDYAEQFRLSAWNTSELGQVIRGFSESIGGGDSAWVIPYPHWVDTRLVGISAGFPRKDYAIWKDQLRETLVVPSPKLFLLHPDDVESLERLRQLYPLGSLQEYQSKIPYKDFRIYFVPPN